MHIVRMQPARSCIVQGRVNVLDNLLRNLQSPVHAVVQSNAMKTLQYEVSLSGMDALREGRMLAEAAINLHLCFKPRTSGRIHLYYQLRMIRMREYRGKIPGPEQAPGSRNVMNHYGMPGVDTLNTEPGKEFPFNRLLDWDCW